MVKVIDTTFRHDSDGIVCDDVYDPFPGLMVTKTGLIIRNQTLKLHSVLVHILGCGFSFG